MLLWRILIPDRRCKDGARLFPKVPSEKMKQGAQTKIMEIPLKHKKKQFYFEVGPTLRQVVQHGCGSSIFGDTQNSIGHYPDQPVVVDPPVTRGHGPDYLQNSFQSQLFSYSVSAFKGEEQFENVDGRWT